MARIRTLGTLIVAALAARYLSVRWHKTDIPATVTGLRNLIERDGRLVRLGARGGRRYAIYRARKTFASAERKEQLSTEFEMATAADVTRELGNMKGAMMKVGQMASYIDSGLPENVRKTLATLQNDAPPMSPELSAEQIERELGKPPDQLFAEWDPTPIAAASIGQVHRAITEQGDAVAVKVQYPGVADAVAADLKNLGWMFGGLATMFPGMEAEPVAAEIRERLIEELDYHREADNQRYFQRAFEDHPVVHVPKVHDAYCTDRILTTELVVGHSLEEVAAWDEAQRNLAAETLFRFSFGSIYQLNAFNGDPHPGNYLFNKDGKVSFLDFGLVKRFSRDETSLFESMIKQMVFRRDMAGFRSVVENAGLLRPNAPFSDQMVGDYFAHYYRYLMNDEPTPIDEAYASAGVSHLLDTDGEFGELMKVLNVPPAFVVVQRITLGLMGLFAKLDANANWHAIAREQWSFVDSEPSTSMGLAIAEWEQRRGPLSDHAL